jgi:hypothetical protein
VTMQHSVGSPESRMSGGIFILPIPLIQCHSLNVPDARHGRSTMLSSLMFQRTSQHLRPFFTGHGGWYRSGIGS